jgi:hypothetical protein
MENAMHRVLVRYCTTAATLAAASFLALTPAKAMNIAAPAALSAAIHEAGVKQDVRCLCGHRAYYRPYAYAYRPYYYTYAYRPYYYTYAYAYRPYYTYAYRPYYYTYAYRPYYYAYTYRPYYSYAYAYRPYYSYAYVGYGRRYWVGWR